MSLGQGQEVVAENALDVAAESGHWVILQVRAPCTKATRTGNPALREGTDPAVTWPS